MKHLLFLQLGKSILGAQFPTQSLPLFCRKEIPFLGAGFLVRGWSSKPHPPHDSISWWGRLPPR